ncbi:hypothetical protein D6855_00515 [Butyrivibrio sp. CB08]|uniref:DUF5722 domain-containing protein n=1 Tax=Butyrivibrio sp. CB08 TaxID=2364879 RepID=UPI000EA9CDC8|nr:DUF5722 domain-containing protein [Butyrivibrio sp. CB08]RKM61934.1 hypothetical protein D6855_00515 [Butyrivibrio sp. CB08]
MSNTRRRRTGRKARRNRRAVILSIAASGILLALVIGLCLWLFLSGRQDEAELAEKERLQEQALFEASLQEEEERNAEFINAATIDHIVGAGRQVSKALSLRPATVEMTDENRAEFVNILSCNIVESSKVEVSVASEGIPKSDDKYYYLFEQATYEESLDETKEPIAKIYKDDETSFSVDLNKGAENTRLFSKFQVAVKMDDKFVPISHAKYITNPGACAGYSYGGMSHKSIKGILPDPLRIGELQDLGCEYATYNIPLNHILVTSGGISYSYGGVTYHFNERIINDYDMLFKRLNNMGIDVAAIILNNASTSAYPEITHPSARSGSTAPYYMFNAADERGVKALAAIGSFLANRYSGSGHGNVSMWIIANEVNARREYNYMSNTDVNTYTVAFTRAFRVFYNAIKSQNSAAQVYIPIDQRWTYNTEKTGDYDAKDVLDIFAASLSEYGNIDWGLAAHPYSFPNGNTAFWKSSKYVNHTDTTPCITMDNIEVLTNYMKRDAMLDTSGNVRSIILSEIGYSSTSGQALQAAAFAYAYTIMEKNGYIDALMLSRQTDASDEIAALGLALGLQTTGGGKKQIYNVFKYIDTDKRDEVVSFAYDIVGKTF